MTGFLSCQQDVSEPVTQPWARDVSISDSDEDVGVQLINLQMTQRGTGLLIDWLTELRFKMIMAGWNDHPT